LTTDSSALTVRLHVRVADEGNVLDLLEPHHAGEVAVSVLVPKKVHAGADIACELFGAHIRFVPTVGGDRPAVALGSRVDNHEDRAPIAGAAAADSGHLAVRLH